MSPYPAAFFISEGSGPEERDRMSDWNCDNMEAPPMYHPIPRRPFEVISAPPEEKPQQLEVPTKIVETEEEGEDEEDEISRTHSVMNLTASTLHGIYEDEEDPSAQLFEDEDEDESSSISILDLPEDLRIANTRPLPQTLRTSNARPQSLPTQKPQVMLRKHYLPLFRQTCSLFVFGVCFGVLVTHLQKSQHIEPVPMPAFAKTTWGYQLTWGFLGVLIGNALPQIDAILKDGEEPIQDGEYELRQTMKIARSKSNASDMIDHEGSSADSGTGLFWQSAVRSIGAFVGIAFAVRRVPWQSTLQVSLTLAVANPVLWYLVDRSKSGFALSSVVAAMGASLLLLINPNFVPLPAIHQDQASEQLGVFTWLASILFCTSLCFGAIGRKFQLQS